MKEGEGMPLQDINKGFMLSNRYIIRNWRQQSITKKQKDYIVEMQKVSHVPLPQFEGKTKGEAWDYIKKYSKLTYINLWSIIHGYD